MAIDRVLIAVGPNDRDHTDNLLDEALSIAAPWQATVYLLHVFPREEYNKLLEQMDFEPRSGGLQPDELASRYESIRSPAHKLDEKDIEYEIRGVIGDPSTEIVRVARELNVDRIFIGGTSRSPAGKALFGDRAQQVLLNAPCPTTYVQHD
ncbi:universal stress protein (plasmid) [Haloferax prahovense]|jgi:nucleotide-binding universal stress UspA family protein|uniref:universal stress protein n=1 Tax=Haloferax prahovense TaxID=381852 RepID=UPI003C763BFA